MHDKTQEQLKQAVSRRAFLKYSGGCTALTSAAVVSTMLQLKTMNSAVAAQGGLPGYKALVCLFLHGGADSFNMLAPLNANEYADYKTVRGNLALNYDPNDAPNSQLIKIIDSTRGDFGMHKGLAGMAELYGQGKVAWLANVGSLVAPTDQGSYGARQNLPLGLFSHADMIRHWQSSVPQSRAQLTGWAGRMADLLTDSVNQHPTISMSMAMNSVNLFETGERVVPYIIGTSGATPLYGYGGNWVPNKIMTDTTDQILAETYRNLFEKTHANVRRASIDAAQEFNNATGGVTLQTVFPRTALGRQLEMIAKTIGASGTLGQTRQIFFLERGGWDHHDGVLNKQAAMLPEIDAALRAFYDATVELGVGNDVTTFTSSDFARTMSSNGNGSDHAWGGNHMIMGGSVLGGRIYGEYPASLRLGNTQDVGRGRLIPTTSVDEYAAELALWYGLTEAEAKTVLPNLSNFYSSGSPIGFLPTV